MSLEPGDPPATDDGAPPSNAEASVGIKIDLRCYRLSAVQKAGYRLAERFTVVLGAQDQDADTLAVTLMFPRSPRHRDAGEAVRLFFQELLDQELREKLGDETRPLRALLLAHAFSKTDLVRRE